MRENAMRCLCLLALGGCSPLTLAPVTGGVVDDGPLDTDGDGWLDEEELELGTDPDDPFSWNFGSRRWPDFTDEAAAAGYRGRKYELGKRIPDFVALDQFGKEVSLSTFYGYVVMLDFVAGWCEPCEDVAADAQAMWEAHRLDGLMIIHVPIDDETRDNVVSEDFPLAWRDAYALEFPVLYDADRVTFEGLDAGGLYDDAVPYMVLLDSELRIDSTWTGGGAQVDAALVRALELLSP